MSTNVSTISPNKGDFFIVESTRNLPEGVRDHSYSTDIFRCIATDALIVVGEKIAPRRPFMLDDGPIVLRRRDYAMYPVSQEVVDAIAPPAPTAPAEV